MTHTYKFSKFEVGFFLVSCKILCNIFDRFLFDFLKMESNNLLDLLNTGFTIIKLKLVCFMVSNRWKQKYANSWLFWHKKAIFGRYLIEEDVWKHFKYWLRSFNVLLKHWSYFPKNTLINSNTLYLLNFFYDFISAFDKFRWMLALKIFLIFSHVHLLCLYLNFYDYNCVLI